MMDNDRNQETKSKYEPPVITRISLRPEEAVLGHCKNSTASGPVGGTCAATSCSAIGS